jgi:transcriptional regulator with XRE-family HTH domain
MGNLLLEKRREMGSKLEDVASVIGVGTSTLHHWEHGEVQTVSINSMANVRNLALLYNVEPQEIVQAIENNYILAHSGHDLGRYRANASSIEVSGDDDNSSDEESIIEITQEAADNLENTDDTITCGKAMDMALDAVFAWGRNRQVYDDMLQTISKAYNTTDASHTIKESQIETYILSLMYGNVSFDTFCIIKDSLKSCLGMMKSFEEE